LARSSDELNALAEDLENEYEIDAYAFPTDIRDPDAVQNTVERTVDEFGRLDVLVNNAGVTGGDFDDHLEEISIEKFQTLTEVNVHGTFYATRASLPHLRASQGTVVFIGSSAGKLPRPGAPVYAASKWWTRGFAHSVEAHAGQDGVAVSLINPTAVRTDIWRDQLDEGEAAEPEEVATLVVTAASQPNHSTLSEVDLFRRDMLGKFIPAELDLDLSYDLGDETDP
jgi:NADP-dependent 3-hydroxy acid dehydrogenase YdfG